MKPHHMGSLPTQLAKQHSVDGKSNRLLLENDSGEESDDVDSEDGFMEDLEQEMMMQGK